ncbi:hypothetical protein [Aminobacter sp. LjRoot7]|uniref:hypothetical protein n=1 Tax=Aminobacter sp. LjRoot7 TaxID=3342335 RepID=UPI003ECE92D1
MKFSMLSATPLGKACKALFKSTSWDDTPSSVASWPAHGRELMTAFAIWLPES